jgi:adenosine deaminase
MDQLNEIQKIAKVELHQHLDGSIPVEVTWGLMKQYNLNPVETIEEMRRLLVVQSDGGTLLEYLSKFHYPLWITQFYENIREVTYAVVKDAYLNHNVRLLELRYAPTIHTYAGMTPRQAIVSVLEGLNRARDEFPDLEVGLIIIAMRHMGPHIAKILARQAISESQSLHKKVGVIGFDIAGAERGNPPHLFREAYEIAKKGGLGLTAHAGEDDGAYTIWQAIDELGCTRVGHGCAAITDEALLKRLAKDQILVEVCQTSNYQTGAAKRSEPHPLFKFLEYNIPVAICTDNTTVSNTNQTKENSLLAGKLTTAEIDVIHMMARKHSFLRLFD